MLANYLKFLKKKIMNKQENLEEANWKVISTKD